MADRTRWAHPDGRFALAVPDGWEVADEPYPGVPLLLLAPADDGFRMNVLLTEDRLDPGTTLRDWQLGTDLLLARTLNDYLLIDLEHVELGGHPGVRRLAAYVAEGGHAVTTEQWAVLAGRSGWTLTATVATMAYPSAREILAEIAAGVRIGER